MRGLQHPDWVTALFFPDVWDDTDWTKEAESLDTELQKLYPEGRAGKRLADKLLKVVSKSGDPRYLHFEIQGDPQDHFERRMFIYQYRGDDRFGLPMEAFRRWPILLASCVPTS